MRAIPFEAVKHSQGALTFDDETGAVGFWALRGMADVWRQEEDVAFFEVDTFGFAVDPEREPGVAFDLVEEFFQRVVVIIGAMVRAAHNGDDEVGVLPDLLIANRGFQEMRVVLNPALEIQWRAVGGHFCLRVGDRRESRRRGALGVIEIVGVGILVFYCGFSFRGFVLCVVCCVLRLVL